MSNGLYLYSFFDKITKIITLYVGESKRNLDVRAKEHEILKSAIARRLYKRNEDISYNRNVIFTYEKTLNDIQAQRTRRTTKETMTMAYLIKKGYTLENTKQMKQAREIAKNNSLSYIKNVLGEKIVNSIETILNELEN